jgi:DNA-binding protein
MVWRVSGRKLFGAIVACCFVGVASWLHVNYMYIGPSELNNLGGFALRKTMTEQMRQAVTALEASANLELRKRLDVFRKDILARFDADFVPQHDSVVKGLRRDANYWWLFGSSWDRNKAEHGYQREIQQTLDTVVLSHEQMVHKLEEMLVDVIEQFLNVSVSASGAMIKRAVGEYTIVVGRFHPSASAMKAPNALVAPYGSRQATHAIISQLDKYYVSEKDAPRIAGKLGEPAKSACNAVVDACERNISQGYQITRESLKRAGIGIGATAARAAAIGNAVGIIVISYKSYKLFNEYASGLETRSQELRNQLDKELQRVIASICDENEGEFPKQLRLISDKIIEQHTKPSLWPIKAG